MCLKCVCVRQTVEEEIGEKHVETRRLEVNGGRALDKASFMCVGRHHAAAAALGGH